MAPLSVHDTHRMLSSLETYLLESPKLQGQASSWRGKGNNLKVQGIPKHCPNRPSHFLMGQ